MVKKVLDGDKLIPVDVLYPPAMVGTALELTCRQPVAGQVPVRGSYILDATLITKENRQGVLFPRITPFDSRTRGVAIAIRS